MTMGHIAFNQFDHETFSRFDLQASDGITLRNPHVDHMLRYGKYHVSNLKTK
jgi:hypothetical protein